MSFDHKRPFLRHCSSPEIALDEHSGLIVGVIIDNDHQIIGIILIEDGLQVVNIPMLLHVIPGGHHNAHRNFIFVLVDIVLALV